MTENKIYIKKLIIAIALILSGTIFLLIGLYMSISNAEDITIRLVPHSKKNCINTTWTPNPSNYCYNINVEQTSNCGDKRIIKGTIQNTTWTPNPSNYCYNIDVEQTSNCGDKRIVKGTIQNTTWTPDLSNYCNDVDVEQTSNCGDKRIMKGTKIPTEWLPSVANKRYCEITTQSNNCYTRQVNGALPDIWTPDPANYWETQTITQTNTCGQTRQVQGTKINKIVRIYKMRATGQCCGYSKNWGYYPCGNCWFDINPNSKTFNSGINVTLGQESGPIPRDGFRTYNDIQVTCSDGQTFYVSGYEVSIGQTWNIPSHPQLRFNQEIRCPP